MADILIIDDDPDFVETHAMVLRKAGYEVSAAPDGESGIARIRERRPDLVILDIMMRTEHEGFEVARRVREELELTELPILIISGIHGERPSPYRFAVDETYLPADVWIDKPVEPAELVARVRAALNETPGQAG